MKINGASDEKISEMIVDAVAEGDWTLLHRLAGEAKDRDLAPPHPDDSMEVMPTDISLGDEFQAVIVHPNSDDDRDPVAKVGGKTTFLRFPEKGTNEAHFGQVVTARMADKQTGHNLAVVVEEENE